MDNPPKNTKNKQQNIKLITWNKGPSFFRNKLNTIKHIIETEQPHVIVIQEANILCTSYTIQLSTQVSIILASTQPLFIVTKCMLVSPISWSINPLCYSLHLDLVLLLSKPLLSALKLHPVLS